MNIFKKPSLNIFLNAEHIAKSRRGNHFRKSLGVYNYKIKSSDYYKNTHALPLKVKTNLKDKIEKKDYVAERELFYLEKNSPRPYGKFSRSGKFNMDLNKVPYYDIPETEKFYLKPFTSKKCYPIYQTEPEDFSKQRLTPLILDKIRTQALYSENKEIVTMAMEMFETEFGKKVIKDFLKDKVKKEERRIVYNKFNALKQYKTTTPETKTRKTYLEQQKYNNTVSH